MACLRLQTGAGEDDIIHLPSGLDRVDCERQEEEEESSSHDGDFPFAVKTELSKQPATVGRKSKSAEFARSETC